MAGFNSVFHFGIEIYIYYTDLIEKKMKHDTTLSFKVHFAIFYFLPKIL